MPQKYEISIAEQEKIKILSKKSKRPVTAIHVYLSFLLVMSPLIFLGIPLFIFFITRCHKRQKQYKLNLFNLNLDKEEEGLVVKRYLFPIGGSHRTFNYLYVIMIPYVDNFLYALHDSDPDIKFKIGDRIPITYSSEDLTCCRL